MVQGAQTTTGVVWARGEGGVWCGARAVGQWVWVTVSVGSSSPLGGRR